MDSAELENRIRALVEEEGFHLLQANWKPMKGGRLLRVVADAEDHNITVDECAALSALICDLLDSHPYDFPDYRLEVSSPGLSHPLENWQYRKNIGRQVEVKTIVADHKEIVRGELIAVDETGITVREKAQESRVRFNVIAETHVLPQWNRHP